MANTVYTTEVVKLQDEEETSATLKPLDITHMTKFMEKFEQLQDAKGEGEILNVLLDLSRISLHKQFQDKVDDDDWLRGALDMPTIYRIIKVCGGIDMEAPKLPGLTEMPTDETTGTI